MHTVNSLSVSGPRLRFRPYVLSRPQLVLRFVQWSPDADMFDIQKLNLTQFFWKATMSTVTPVSRYSSKQIMRAMIMCISVS